MFDTANYLSFSEKLNDEIGINNTNIHTFAQISVIQQHKDRKKGGKGGIPPLLVKLEKLPGAILIYYCGSNRLVQDIYYI